MSVVARLKYPTSRVLLDGRLIALYYGLDDIRNSGEVSIEYSSEEGGKAVMTFEGEQFFVTGSVTCEFHSDGPELTYVYEFERVYA